MHLFNNYFDLTKLIFFSRTSSNIEHEDHDENSWLEDHEVGADSEQPTSSNTYFKNPPKKKKTNLNAFQSSLLERFDSLKDETDINPDKAFLLSILPDFQSLSQAKKTDFRLYVLNFFKNQNSQQINYQPQSITQQSQPPQPVYPDMHLNPQLHHSMPQQFHLLPQISSYHPHQLYQYQEQPSYKEPYSSIQQDLNVLPSSQSTCTNNLEKDKTLQ